MELSGNVFRSGKDLSLQRGGLSGFSVAQYGGRIAKDPLSRWKHGLCLHLNAPSNERVSKPVRTIQEEEEHCSPVLWQSIRSMNFKLKAGRRRQCYLSSDPYSSRHIEHTEDGLGSSKRKQPQPKIGKANKNRICYKSEEYDIRETKADCLPSNDGTGEAILLEGNAQVSPWWQQFPKRWVIVLLCFAAFLLCNMDRVSTIMLFTYSCFPCPKFLIGIFLVNISLVVAARSLLTLIRPSY